MLRAYVCACVCVCHTQGDVVVHLSEAARDELSSPLSQVNRPRLKSLLELALRTSSLAQVRACTCMCACVFWCVYAPLAVSLQRCKICLESQCVAASM